MSKHCQIPSVSDAPGSVESRDARLKEAQKIVQEKTSGTVSLADELIADRRAEEQRESGGWA